MAVTRGGYGVQVVDGGHFWAQTAGDPRVAWLSHQLASATLAPSSRVHPPPRPPPRFRVAVCGSHTAGQQTMLILQVFSWT